ncbi:hypothetical protein EXIGLDRAFT_171561 [Exidia glandulosa HHB12029]|uniref:Uncharacterized protein n=1 Tax=Exidia glandulosa HHB12029 TaxID=1314781 RepID=A0A165FB94_EXIGL|nr:hypothetical protein EXIGLDRAFT_171561 [Exidia glandulosa HHB12029]
MSILGLSGVPIIVAQGNAFVPALAPRRALGLGLSGVPDIDDPYFRVAFPFSTPAAGPVYDWSPSGDGVHPQPRLVMPRPVVYCDTVRECPPPLPKYRVVDLPATPMPPVKEEMQSPTPPSTPPFTAASLASTGHYVQSTYISGPQQGITMPTAGAGSA